MINKARFVRIVSMLIFGCVVILSEACNASQATVGSSGGRDTAIMNFLKKQPAFSKLSARERDVLYWVNEVRVHPREFYDKHVASYVSANVSSHNANVRSLKNELYKASPVTPLIVVSTLNQTSKNHAIDLARHQQFSHNSSDGTSFSRRMAKAGINISCSENIFNGGESALDAVITLLIDEGVPGYGHRRNLLNKKARLIGVAFLPYNSSSFIMVQDFVTE
ncbi:CAP domain-containing protein [Pinibacter aurantiacus]|uniref:CAP domain-containing protein n=1 Tax=Pinibacter aurantiacus TaxID=2851599 RepID=A0A9E2SAA4_9BACT|nr:CAP domain-containing protein [Pinibacter aurantiacus]MBV4356765.1 CAP domain-containing protein [Pinibacter aurantiacus]